jgi:hypothetical protein
VDADTLTKQRRRNPHEVAVPHPLLPVAKIALDRAKRVTETSDCVPFRRHRCDFGIRSRFVNKL